MATSGFALYSDVNEQMLRDLPPTPAKIETPDHYDFNLGRISGQRFASVISQNPSGSSLYLVMQQARQDLPARDKNFYDKYDVSEADKKLAERKTAGYGFADIDFTWHFAAGLANEVTDFFVDEGVITREQKNNFNLHDWATIIGSGWFSKLVHQMTPTSNGNYGQFGNTIYDYVGKQLYMKLIGRKIIDANTLLFEFQQQTEPLEDASYDTAILSKSAIKGLRGLMTQNDSIGCPVARYSAHFDADDVHNNPHLKNLVASGRLSVDGARPNGKVRVSQQMTAIDNTLAFFALQLDNYGAAYGTPVMTIDNGNLIVNHLRLPTTDVCRQKLENCDPNAEKLLGEIALAA